MSKTFISQRRDGRGHWPIGKARNQPSSRVVTMIRRARRYLNYREMGRLCGIDHGQLRRYATGERNPCPLAARRIELWLELYQK